jgi:hypothetical protein
VKEKTPNNGIQMSKEIGVRKILTGHKQINKDERKWGKVNKKK